MLIHLLETLNKRRIVLASGSPRRKELLEGIGLRIEVIPSTFPENLDKASFANPAEYVLENSKLKALEVQQRLRAADPASTPFMIISADTVVVIDGEILEKPTSPEHAAAMLRRLSGRTHHVITGVTLVLCEDQASPLLQFSESTTVQFAALGDDLISAYVATREPMDKAGSYGIQGLAGTFVQRIDGDFYNVVGFPLHAFTAALADRLDT
eukprot:m.81221 g.81221  ORF g.81221 m.81221 type:complete len:211 (+) comp13358_c0_seq2:113-745(+)